MENVNSLPFRVAIVDDHILVSEMLALSISKATDLTLVGIASSTIDAKKLIKRERPNVILMNYRMPDGDCLTTVREILRELPDARVVLLSAHIDPELSSNALGAGCVGLLGKDSSIGGVLAAVRAAARGELSIRTDQYTTL
jgi:DNA-binding NarL/FixJ family response regulator